MPIHKKGKRSQPNNYRPVSLTSVTCKILEHVICHHIWEHLEQHNILSDFQHGFRKRRNCETQLILTLHDLVSAVNEGKRVDAFILDFSKAFDRVPHGRLLYKLNHYGINGNLLAWVEDFLSERTQSVALAGVSSMPCRVTSGVPQGTVLGPLLFLLYVNDLPSCISSSIRLFADDCLLYRTINDSNDSLSLQNDLNALSKWESSANQTLGVIRRNFRTASVECKYQLFCSLVRPKLEYANSAWYPYIQKDKHLLDMVQRSATRVCYNSYLREPGVVTNMLNELEWPSLEGRRTLSRMSMFHRVVYGAVDIENEPYLIPMARTSRNGNSKRFLRPHSNCNQHANSFFPWGINYWNKLPGALVDIKDSTKFKGELITYMKQKGEWF